MSKIRIPAELKSRIRIERGTFIIPPLTPVIQKVTFNCLTRITPSYLIAQDGSGGFISITAAFAALSSLSVPTNVFLSPGTYAENYLTQPPYVHLVGLSQSDCIIHGNFYTMSSNTSIDTITVQSGTNSNSVRFGITIKNSAENIIINNCKIISIAWAIYTEWDGFGNFNHISITNCELIGSNPIYLQGCSDSLIENNFGIFSGGSYEGVCLAFIDSTEIFNNNIIRGNTFSLSRTDGEDTIAYPYIMRFYGHNNLIENNNISVVQPGKDYPYEARGFLEYGGLIDTPVSIITNTIRNNTFAITRKVVGYQYALCIILNQEGETTLAYADNLLKNNIFTYNCLDDPSQLLGSMYSYETSINHKVIIDTGGWQGSSRSIEHLTPKTTLEIL